MHVPLITGTSNKKYSKNMKTKLVFVCWWLYYFMFAGKKLSEQELNSLIAHAHRRIEQLQHQLANHLALEKERIQQALESQRQADESVCDRRIQDEVQKIRNSTDLEKQKWVKN